MTGLKLGQEILGMAVGVLTIGLRYVSDVLDAIGPSIC
jgi:hypothetical protein